MSFFKSSVPEMTVHELNASLKDDSPPTLLDVRQARERAIASLGGIHIPLNELTNRIEELEDQKGQPIVVYCRSGGRSARAVKFMRTQGFDAINLKGGTLAWSNEIDPSLPIY